MNDSPENTFHPDISLDKAVKAAQLVLQNSGETAEQGQHKPLDYHNLVEGDVDIIFFGEHHNHTDMFQSVDAQAMHEAGVRAFFLEAPADQDFSDLNSGDFTRLDANQLNIGPTRALLDPTGYSQDGQDPVREARKTMIKNLVREGISIVPIDDPEYWEVINSMRTPNPIRRDGHTLRNHREETMQNNLREAVATYGKVAGTIGRAHTRKGVHKTIHGEDHRETAQRSIENGFSVRTVCFYGNEQEVSASLLVDGKPSEKPYMYKPLPNDPLTISLDGIPDSPDWIAYIPPAQGKDRKFFLKVTEHYPTK